MGGSVEEGVRGGCGEEGGRGEERVKEESRREGTWE